jgi:hypothetical protein
MDDFTKYEKLHDAGANSKQVYLAGKADGLDQITLVRLIRKLFNLSLAEAKETQLQAEEIAASLTDFQEILVPLLQKLASEDQETNGAPIAKPRAPTSSAQ